jgi:hypothetical protein
MLLNRRWYESGDARHGDWSRDQLEAMDSRFCEVVEQAFERGLESRAAATAIFGGRKQREEAIEAAIEAAWRLCCDKDFDLPFAAAVEFARARCPGVGVDSARVRIGFELRFKRGELGK